MPTILDTSRFGRDRLYILNSGLVEGAVGVLGKPALLPWTDRGGSG